MTQTQRKHEKTKKERMAGIPVVLQVCKADEALLGKVRRKRSNLELGDAVRAKRHRRRSGYNTKVERLGAKSPSISGGIVKYTHKKKKEMTTVRKPERNETSGDRGGREKTKKT